MLQKISVCLLAVALILTACSSNMNSANGSSNLSSDISAELEESSEAMTSNTSSAQEEQLTTNPKESYHGEVKVDGIHQLTNDQLLFINEVLNSLSEAKIIYPFQSIDDIKAEDFPTYLGFRSKYYSDITLDNELNALLDYNQILAILKDDFGIEQSPKWLEDKKGEMIKTPVSSQGNPCEMISVEQKGNMVTVIAKMYPTVVRDASEKEFAPSNMKYLFELSQDNRLYIKSGAMI